MSDFLDEQAMAMAQVAQATAEAAAGTPGPAGKSAYELARDQGYGGTLTQWLATLVGAAGQNGAPGAKGDKGDPGTPGTDGAPGPNLARRAIVNTGALTANTAKDVAVTWPAAMPSTTYAVVAMVETATPQTVAVSLKIGSRTTTGCTLVVRSTAAVNASGLNVGVVGLA